MKTPMLHTRNFFRKNQRMLAASLLLASLNSCTKGVLEPTTEMLTANTLSTTVTTNSISSLIVPVTREHGTTRARAILS